MSKTLTQQRLESRSFNKNSIYSTHDIYNTDSCQRQKDDDRQYNCFSLMVAEIAILTSVVEVNRYPYGIKKDGEFKRLGKGGPTNEEKKADAMRRVIEYVANFEGVWPMTIRDRRSLIAKLAKCSEKTLAKAEYLPLWHLKYMSSESEDLTTTDTDLCTEKICDPTLTLNCEVWLASPQEREKSPLFVLLLFDCLSRPHCTIHRTPLMIEIAQTFAVQALQPIEPKNSRKLYHTQNTKIQSWRSRTFLLTRRCQI